jgi:hypothetical protein
MRSFPLSLLQSAYPIREIDNASRQEQYHLLTAHVFRSDSPPARSRRSIGSGGESSSMLTSVEGSALQPG